MPKNKIDSVEQWIDLTHPLDKNTLFWPTSQPFKLDTVFEGQTEKDYYYSAYNFCMAEHGGTHIDAPVHFAEGKNSIDQIPIEQLIGNAIVIDVSLQSSKDPDYLVSTADFQNWEIENGEIPKNSIVIINTGYHQYWPDPLRYMGTNKKGEEGVQELHFPGLSPKAADWLVKKKIKAIGIDTPSIDFGQSNLYQSHRTLFEANIPAFENVGNLNSLPLKDFMIYAFPIKISGGSGGPVRILAKIKSTR
ncbi:cyclase family protein [Cytophagales bacterium RKSG123]|nr:cyclase family protein [Xanthovirga aplysinae]